MWFLLLVLALIIIAAQAMLWRLQRRLLTNLQISQERVRALEETVRRLTVGHTTKETNASHAARDTHGGGLKVQSRPTEESEEKGNRYRRARMLAESGRNACYIASACQIGEEEAELLIRLNNRPPQK